MRWARGDFATTLASFNGDARETLAELVVCLVPTYAQVVGVVNSHAGERDYLMAIASSLPGEAMKKWCVKQPSSFDCEFGVFLLGL